MSIFIKFQKSNYKFSVFNPIGALNSLTFTATWLIIVSLHGSLFLKIFEKSPTDIVRVVFATSKLKL
jgi:hypothetical protein